MVVHFELEKTKYILKSKSAWQFDASLVFCFKKSLNSNRNKLFPDKKNSQKWKKNSFKRLKLRADTASLISHGPILISRFAFVLKSGFVGRIDLGPVQFWVSDSSPVAVFAPLGCVMQQIFEGQLQSLKMEMQSIFVAFWDKISI